MPEAQSGFTSALQQIDPGTVRFQPDRVVFAPGSALGLQRAVDMTERLSFDVHANLSFVYFFIGGAIFSFVFFLFFLG